MEISKPEFSKYIFICENERLEGGCCAPEGTRLRELLKNKVKERGLSKKIRVSRSGCLDLCEEGPSILLMPDNIWFKKVTENDIEAVLKKAVEGI